MIAIKVVIKQYKSGGSTKNILRYLSIIKITVLLIFGTRLMFSWNFRGFIDFTLYIISRKPCGFYVLWNVVEVTYHIIQIYSRGQKVC